MAETARSSHEIVTRSKRALLLTEADAQSPRHNDSIMARSASPVSGAFDGR